MATNYDAFMDQMANAPTPGYSEYWDPVLQQWVLVPPKETPPPNETLPPSETTPPGDESFGPSNTATGGLSSGSIGASVFQPAMRTGGGSGGVPLPAPAYRTSGTMGGAGSALAGAQDQIRAVTEKAGAGLEQSVKDVAPDQATASPRALAQALGGGAVPSLGAAAGPRRAFGSPVNLQALLNQLR